MDSSARSDTKILDQIINSDGIASSLIAKYPNVYELLQWDLEKTAGILQIKGAFQMFKFDQYLNYEQHGSDNFKVWSDYEEGIHHYLKSINDDRRLGQARTAIADHIHDVHFQKFPYWPTIEESKQQSEVFIDIAASYPFESWYIGWSCLGFITVQDFRLDINSYYTDFHGRPQLKILFCNDRKLREFEQLAVRDMDEARRQIEAINAPLHWDNFLT